MTYIRDRIITPDSIGNFYCMQIRAKCNANDVGPIAWRRDRPGDASTMVAFIKCRCRHGIEALLSRTGTVTYRASTADHGRKALGPEFLLCTIETGVDNADVDTVAAHVAFPGSIDPIQGKCTRNNVPGGINYASPGNQGSSTADQRLELEVARLHIIHVRKALDCFERSAIRQSSHDDWQERVPVGYGIHACRGRDSLGIGFDFGTRDQPCRFPYTTTRPRRLDANNRITI